MATMAENKTRFLSLLNEVGRTRKGVDRLANWLETTDFFTAPASTRFHGAYEGGLLEHSLNVYDTFVYLFEKENDPKDSVILCTLFHDLCKCGMYAVEMRNRKNDAGVWEKVPFYIVDDKFPYGHGEKSVFLVERFVRLKNEEAMAIRWHMGGSYSIATAYNQYPFAVKLHLADLYATYITESKTVQTKS